MTPDSACLLMSHSGDDLQPARTSHSGQVYHSLVLFPSTPRMLPNVGATWLHTLASDGPVVVPSI